MLALGRYDGQWVEIRHQQSGDLIRIRVYNIRGGSNGGRATLAFDDAVHNFAISRPEASGYPRDDA